MSLSKIIYIMFGCLLYVCMRKQLSSILQDALRCTHCVVSLFIRAIIFIVFIISNHFALVRYDPVDDFKQNVTVH